MAIVEGTLMTPAVRLVRPLAAGGMGTVWVADHLTLHTQVAVKIMTAELSKNPEVSQRFTREAAASARVKSPHVVQVFDHGVTEDEQLPFIVMELLEGRDLGHLVRPGEPLDPELVIAVITQTCKALGRAHAAGVIHRDIKPDNIFLCDTDGGEVFLKLLDFGIARNDAGPEVRVTAPGSVFGTPLYMSPEQLVGNPVDHRTDLWSLGVVAFEAFTGTMPYEADNIGAVAIAAHAPLPKPSSRNADLPPWVDEWFAKACAKEPEDRFENAAEMARFVTQAAGDQRAAVSLPPRASSPSPRDPERSANTVAPSSQGPRAQTGTGAKWGAAIAVLAVVVALLFVLTRGDEPAAPTPVVAASVAAPPAAPSVAASAAPELPSINPSSLPASPVAPASAAHRPRPASSSPSKPPKKPAEYDDIK